MIFAGLELAQRLEKSEGAGGARYVEARRRLTPGTESEWIEVAGTYAMFDGAGSPVTQTFGLGLFAEATPEHLDRLERFFQERRAPVFHEVSPLAGVALLEMLCLRGYCPVELTNVMYKPLEAGGLPEAGNPRIRTRLMRQGEEKLLSEVSAGGWAEFPEYTHFLLDSGRLIAESEGAFCFFAEMDGTPVATGALRTHEGVALFAGASTLPEARRQGAQQALMIARVNLARSQGCDLLMMCAQPGSGSQRNAERHGFRIAYTRTKWKRCSSQVSSLPTIRPQSRA
jgi:GNAT superfamily N-acetyltransferase